MQNLLGIEGLKKERLINLIDSSEKLLEVGERDIKKVPTLRGKTTISIFSESSTRTKSSFEIAAKRMSADHINLSTSTSSTTKGETLLDTIRTLESMNPDAIIIRHKYSGAPKFLSYHIKDSAIINAGDGTHEHPTQALINLLSIKQAIGKIEGIRFAIVGDIRHSRVARSDIFAHSILGNEIHLVGPRTLVPDEFADKKTFNGNIKIFHNVEEGIEGADIILCLRMQLERETGHFVTSIRDYFQNYIITDDLVDKYAPNAFIMHPGPINRGIEISSTLADGKRSLIRNQVNNGIAVRMAVLVDSIFGSKEC